MNISEVNLMSSKKENQISSSKSDQAAKLGKSICNGSINMRYTLKFQLIVPHSSSYSVF